MLNYCTLFNTNYLAAGLAMYRSLQKQCSEFRLFVFAFDDATEKTLKTLNYPEITVIGLNEFETTELLKVKQSRSLAEYCWTSTPFTILHCLQNFGLNHCTYVDADIYFYSNPQVLFEELGSDSIFITPHNYSEGRDQSATAGIYCVQYITFKNDEKGNLVLKKWADLCLDWCFARYEDGKFGDQKYLDSWPYMFEGIKVCRNFGAGFAPWNQERYSLYKAESEFWLNETKEKGPKQNLVFYHFHYLKFYKNRIQYLGDYNFLPEVINQIYGPYIQERLLIAKELESFGLESDPNGAVTDFNFPVFTWRDQLYLWRKSLAAVFMAFGKELFGNSYKIKARETKKNYLNNGQWLD